MNGKTPEAGPLTEGMRRLVAAQIDEALMRTVKGNTPATCTVAAAPAEPLTLDTLQRMVAAMPKPLVCLSTRWAPPGRAIRVEGGAECFAVAHPSFWLLVEREQRRNLSDSGTMNNVLGLGITWAIEIDPWPGDDQETAKWRADHWRRLREAIQVAMMPLPDWLRSAPQFGSHG